MDGRSRIPSTPVIIWILLKGGVPPPTFGIFHYLSGVLPGKHCAERPAVHCLAIYCHKQQKCSIVILLKSNLEFGDGRSKYDARQQYEIRTPNDSLEYSYFEIRAPEIIRGSDRASDRGSDRVSERSSGRATGRPSDREQVITQAPDGLLRR